MISDNGYQLLDKAIRSASTLQSRARVLANAIPFFKRSAAILSFDWIHVLLSILYKYKALGKCTTP